MKTFIKANYQSNIKKFILPNSYQDLTCNLLKSFNIQAEKQNQIKVIYHRENQIGEIKDTESFLKYKNLNTPLPKLIIEISEEINKEIPIEEVVEINKFEINEELEPINIPKIEQEVNKMLLKESPAKRNKLKQEMMKIIDKKRENFEQKMIDNLSTLYTKVKEKAENPKSSQSDKKNQEEKTLEVMFDKNCKKYFKETMKAELKKMYKNVCNEVKEKTINQMSKQTQSNFL